MAQLFSTAPEDALHDGERDTLVWLHEALPDDSLRNRLYTGMTRARYRLVMLVSPAAGQVLLAQLQGA